MSSRQVHRIPLRDVIIATIGFNGISKNEVLKLIKSRLKYFDNIKQEQIDGIIRKLYYKGLLNQIIEEGRYLCRLTFNGLVEYSVIKDQYPVLQPKNYR